MKNWENFVSGWCLIILAYVSKGDVGPWIFLTFGALNMGLYYWSKWK